MLGCKWAHVSRLWWDVLERFQRLFSSSAQKKHLCLLCCALIPIMLSIRKFKQDRLLSANPGVIDSIKNAWGALRMNPSMLHVKLSLSPAAPAGETAPLSSHYSDRIPFPQRGGLFLSHRRHSSYRSRSVQILQTRFTLQTFNLSTRIVEN